MSCLNFSMTGNSIWLFPYRSKILFYGKICAENHNFLMCFAAFRWLFPYKGAYFIYGKKSAIYFTSHKIRGTYGKNIIISNFFMVIYLWKRRKFSKNIKCVSIWKKYELHSFFTKQPQI